MLTLLEPPSPVSSTGPREVERSLQTTPQLQEVLPMSSPPESHPGQHRDAAQSSRAIPVFKRLQARFKKTNKIQASHPPGQLSTTLGRPPDHRFNSQSQPTGDIATGRRSTMAAGQRVRVSVFFFGRQMTCGMSDKASQRVVAVRIDPVRCSVYSVAPLSILRDSVT